MTTTTRRHPASRTAGKMEIPPTMRAAAIDRFGPPEELKLHELPTPTIDENEVLIALETAGVGVWDADMRAGWLPDGEKPRFPLVLGTDGAGTIAMIGARVRRLHVGDAVYSYNFINPKGGFYAEYVVVQADKVAHAPEGLDLLHAGAIPTTGLTALQGVDDALRLRSGESIIIHGASGGVGSLAIQFAKIRGGRVLATATGDDGLDFVRSLGADAAVDGKREDLTAAARAFAPDGVDAVLAFAGGEALERALDAVKPGGRLAYPNGVEPEPKKRHGIHITPYDAISGVHEFERLSHAVEDAQLKVPIAATYPLEDAAKAHQRLAAKHVLGKIVLQIR